MADDLMDSMALKASLQEAEATKAGEDDDAMTPEERTQWLRSHGVTVESPEELRGEAPKGADELPEYSWTYVKIPIDSAAPMELLTATSTRGGDALPAILKPRFATAESVDHDKIRAQAQKQFGEAGAKLSPEAFASVTKGGSVETLALVHPDSSNGYCGVYAYLDEVGTLKGLELNPRAGGLAEAVGKSGVKFYGDIYVGRVQTEPPPMRCVNLTVEELSSDAEWVKRAAKENAEWDAQMASFRADNDGGTSNCFEEQGVLASGAGAEGYTWNQTEEDLEVTLPLPAGATKKTVEVAFAQKKLSVTATGSDGAAVTFEGPLYDMVTPGECSWTVTSTKAGTDLLVTLEKRYPGAWPVLFIRTDI